MTAGAGLQHWLAVLPSPGETGGNTQASAFGHAMPTASTSTLGTDASKLSDDREDDVAAASRSSRTTDSEPASGAKTVSASEEASPITCGEGEDWRVPGTPQATLHVVPATKRRCRTIDRTVLDAMGGVVHGLGDVRNGRSVLLVPFTTSSQAAGDREQLPRSTTSRLPYARRGACAPTTECLDPRVRR